jgi:hypothetical protein
MLQSRASKNRTLMLQTGTLLKRETGAMKALSLA